MQHFYEKINNAFPEMVEIRRYLHQHPEVSFREFHTAKYITDYYDRLDIPYRDFVGGNGIVATISCGNPGKTVALRADFDALPIQDEKDVPYKSTVPGVMHACGHDGHTATLLVLAKILNEIKDELHGTFILIHQHAEEYAPGGATLMIEDGCLNGVDAIFGTHLWSTEPTGTIEYRTGPIMAAADRFGITINGSGGHGAFPDITKDAIVVASNVVVELQQVVSRRINPLHSAVVSVGSFVSDNPFNVIADSVQLVGTTRSFDENVRKILEVEMEKIVKGVCAASDCTYEYNYVHGYPPVVNHKKETKFLAAIAKDIPSVTNVVKMKPVMGGEDFAYYLQHVPGTFFFTGAKAEGVENPYPHHHPKFDIDENAMKVAAHTLGMAAIQYAKNE